MVFIFLVPIFGFEIGLVWVWVGFGSCLSLAPDESGRQKASAVFPTMQVEIEGLLLPASDFKLGVVVVGRLHALV